MAAQFFAGLNSGSITQPDALINAVGPNLSIPSWAPPQIQGRPDGEINERRQLLESVMPYAYGPNPARISTQTQNAHPNKVPLVITRLFIPAAQGNAGCVQDPILEHATTDGDLVFALRMNQTMQSLGRQYCIMPYTNSIRCMKLLNLATVNYLLWGLQVGTALGEGRDWRWKAFFSYLCMGQQQGFEGGNFTPDVVWNFLQTYIAPFGVQHGSDMQGGQHEGKNSPVWQSADYVAAFAVEGRLHKVNNLWRCCDIEENDDLILELTYMPPQKAHIPFSLCSSVRASRTENAPVPVGWWYLAPAVLKFKTIINTPHIHVGRSQTMLTGYGGNKWGLGMPPWNAGACAAGTPILMTFEPDFVESDAMLERKALEWVLPGMDLDASITQRQLAESLEESDAHILFTDIAATKRLHAAVREREEQTRREAEAREQGASKATGGGGLPTPIALLHAAPAATAGGPTPSSSAAAVQEEADAGSPRERASPNETGAGGAGGGGAEAPAKKKLKFARPPVNATAAGKAAAPTKSTLAQALRDELSD